MHLTAPKHVYGKTEYETENVLVRFEQPVENRMIWSRPQLVTPIKIENKRDVLAWFDTNRSCVVYPNNQATNLLFNGMVIPGGCWAKRTIRRISLDPTNADVWQMEMNADVPPYSGEYRILLKMIWEDERSETVDLRYEVKAKYPDSVSN